MWFLLATMVPTASAATPDAAAVLARVHEIAELRSLRMAPSPPAIPDDAVTEAANGGTPTGFLEVPGQAAKKVWGLAMADQPIGALWAAINDETHLPGYTTIGYSEIVSGKVCVSGRHTLQYLPLSVFSDRWWITMPVANEKLWEASQGLVRELSWSSSVDPSEVTSAKGREIVSDATPLGFSKGGWFFVAIDATHTLVEYDVWADPGGNIPAGLASSFAAGGVPDNIAAIVRFAKDGKSICPTDRP